MTKFCLTFDLDFIDYTSNKQFDELEECLPILLRAFRKFPNIKATWFIRTDSQLECMFGRSDFFLHKHRQKIEWLTERGHEIGWHHHAYCLRNQVWKQNVIEESVCEELAKYGEIAASYGMKSTRMGWGFHTNKTIKILDDLGFWVDSSAIPRPKYSWDTAEKNWELTGLIPYKPAACDYRIQGDPHLEITELPMTTTTIAAPGDTMVVQRYINPAYYHNYFRQAIDRVLNINTVVLICSSLRIARKWNDSCATKF